MNIPQEVKDAIFQLEWMRKQWDETPTAWKDTGFSLNRIEARNKDLKNVKILLDFIDKEMKIKIGDKVLWTPPANGTPEKGVVGEVMEDGYHISIKGESLYAFERELTKI